jgi:hypothetical protein
MCENNFEGENYPTHVTRLWIDNDEISYNVANDYAKQLEHDSYYLNRPEVYKDDAFKDMLWDLWNWGDKGGKLEDSLFFHACEQIDWRSIRRGLL